MLFNSSIFLVFITIVYFSYWFLNRYSIKIQNLFILVVSYFFYGWWNWKFLFLIFISSLADYAIGLFIAKMRDKKYRKILLISSLCVNLGILGFFKYYNFFVQSFIDLFSSFGTTIDFTTLNIILPVGISFYTFQTLSYTIDIYNKKIEPTKDIISFFAFVSFFPQLVAGPIERAKNLLPQFFEKRKFSYPQQVSGLRLILWGFFKKVVVADTCGFQVNQIFSQYQEQTSMMLVLGVVFFAFQIYCDFSGYSDIAIGVARLLGFTLMTNFLFPYFSKNIVDFWRRWHISLSTWFRDYVFIPLGGNRCSKRRWTGNIILTFTVSGLWHGANWTYIVWGFLNGLYYLPYIFKKNQITSSIKKSVPLTFLGILCTFVLICFSWVFFRAPNIYTAWDYILHIFTSSIFVFPSAGFQALAFILVLLCIEIFLYFKIEVINFIMKFFMLRYAAYYTSILLILHYATQNKTPFIYFQF